MEPKKLSELIPATLQTLSPIKSESGGELSIYKGELTAQCLVSSVATIKKSFPSLPIGFYDVFIDRLKANNFSDDRLIDAVAHVIDTCLYPTPTIANFISFDKRVKTYTYAQYTKLIDNGENGANYQPVKFRNMPALVWVHVNDIAKYNIKSKE
jgi:hypothetical protein